MLVFRFFAIGEKRYPALGDGSSFYFYIVALEGHFSLRFGSKVDVYAIFFVFN